MQTIDSKVKHLTFVSSNSAARLLRSKKTIMSTFATEFIAVQEALGIKVNGMSNAAFREADEANADRISTMNHKGIYAVWVDSNLVVVEKGGRMLPATKEIGDKLFADFWASPVI